MHIDEGWNSTEVYLNSIRGWTGKVVTVGQVMHEDDNVVVVGMSYDTSNQHWYGAQLIFKQNIVERSRLRVRESVKNG